MLTLDAIAKATTQRARLADYAAQLGLDELDALLMVAEGFAAGRKRYGELRVDHDVRDFADEGAQELRDCLAYVGAELIRLRRRSAAR